MLFTEDDVLLTVVKEEQMHTVSRIVSRNLPSVPISSFWMVLFYITVSSFPARDLNHRPESLYFIFNLINCFSSLTLTIPYLYCSCHTQIEMNNE